MSETFTAEAEQKVWHLRPEGAFPSGVLLL